MRSKLILAGLAALILAVQYASPASAAFSKLETSCGGWSKPRFCAPEVRAKAVNRFSFMLLNSGGYTVAKVWLRGKSSLPAATHWFDMAAYNKNFIDGEAIFFSFDEAFLVKALGIPMSLVKQGVDIELRIKSEGLGSGLRDTCKVAEIKYDDSKSDWIWRLKGSDSWRLASTGNFFMYYTGGTVNAAKCRFDKVEGSVVTE